LRCAGVRGSTNHDFFAAATVTDEADAAAVAVDGAAVAAGANAPDRTVARPDAATASAATLRLGTVKDMTNRSFGEQEPAPRCGAALSIGRRTAVLKVKKDE
jgi:hypothetical protein